MSRLMIGGGLDIFLPEFEEPLHVDRPGPKSSWVGDDEWGRRFGLGTRFTARLSGFALAAPLLSLTTPQIIHGVSCTAIFQVGSSEHFRFEPSDPMKRRTCSASPLWSHTGAVSTRWSCSWMQAFSNGSWPSRGLRGERTSSKGGASSQFFAGPRGLPASIPRESA